MVAMHGVQRFCIATVQFWKLSVQLIIGKVLLSPLATGNSGMFVCTYVYIKPFVRIKLYARILRIVILKFLLMLILKYCNNCMVHI